MTIAQNEQVIHLPQLLSQLRNGGAVAVVGLGVSGIESALYLSSLGIKVVCLEQLTEDRYLERSRYAPRLAELRAGLINAAPIELHFGLDGERIGPVIEDVKLVVVSPGVPAESSVIGALQRRKVPCVSEFELGITLAGARAIMVTGSNGKSTTVALLQSFLESGRLCSKLCGNIGTPVIAELPKGSIGPIEDDLLVIEASSYQLESSTILKPSVAVLLNMSENHLERHGTMQRYFEAKCRMFQRQDAMDTAVINLDDPMVGTLAGRLGATTLGVTSGEHLPLSIAGGALIRYSPKSGLDEICFRVAGRQEVLSTAGIQLIGRHNRYDIASAALAALVVGVPLSVISEALQRFTPLDHRLQFLPKNGPDARRIIVNDSKATTVAASVAAVQALIEQFPGCPFILMLGGLAKAGSWAPLIAILKQHRDVLIRICCFGKDGRLLADHCKAAGLPYSVQPTMKTAVAEVLAGPDSMILFSPGCASFDEFTDFEQRGDMFKYEVANLSSAASPQ